MSKKIIFVSTSVKPFELFLKDIIFSLSKNYQIIIITNKKGNTGILNKYRFIHIPISRGIKFFYDFIALIKLTFLIREIQPSLIISITPKGGFLSVLSNFLLKFKHLHFITGQNWISKKGLKKLFLKTIDKITIAQSNFQLADSKSQIKFLNNERININKIKLINNGSICGVDTNIFKPDLIFKQKQRKFFGITDNEIIILYIGRINQEKGVFKLYQVCKKLFIDSFPIKIFFVGDIEDNSFFDLIDQDKKSIGIIRYYNFTKSPEDFMKIADIFCLPSFREGFGLSVIEASSTELPVIGSNIIGLEESIVNKETGLLFDLEDDFDFYNKLKKLILSKNLREILGIKGRKRVIQYFKNNDVSKFVTSYIDEILN